MYKIPANTLFIGQTLVFMPECHSTNDEASRLIQKGNILDGTTIVTDHQTVGRGQRGNLWVSEEKRNLTFSIILKPTFLLVIDQFYLNRAVSLGIHDYLKTIFTEDVKIKWPNDIIVQKKKVSGILIENQLSQQKIQHSIVGIGLNVNQLEFLHENASSIRLLAGKEFVLSDELENVLEKIEGRYLMLKESSFEKLFSDFHSSLYWLGEQHTFSSKGEKFEGKVLGVDKIGRLEIETDNGVKTFVVKDVEFLA